MNGTVGQVIKQSFLYSYVLSQPFAVYVDAYPVFQNKILLEAENVQYGEHGESVRVLQTKLNTLDYFDDSIDGEYGVFTEHALKEFQSDHHITITGQADQETIRTLVESEVDRELSKLEHLSSSIEVGMKNEDVEIVQESLAYFGYYTGEIDGIYGPLTKKGVEIAEDNHDLDLTTEETEDSLEQMYDTVEEDIIEQEENTTTEQTEQHESEESEKNENQTEVKNVETTSSINEDVVEVAQSLIGTPYNWGGTSPDGFDCSGFVQFVYDSEDTTVPRTVSDLWNFSKPVDSPSVGDLVFFETYKSGPSHLGIYIGNDEFVHAGETNGVEISNLNYDYWESRYLGAKRIE